MAAVSQADGLASADHRIPDPLDYGSISGGAETAFKSQFDDIVLTKQPLWGCCLDFNCPLRAAARFIIVESLC